MISNKRAIGSVKPSSFHYGKVLRPVLDSSTLKSWVLTNGTVSFTFIEDKSTGVRLYSWEEARFSSPVLNKARSLWSLGMLHSYRSASEGSSVFYETSVLYPNAGSFISPSQIPNVNGNVKSFTFRWENVRYDRKRPNLTCDVEVIASLDTTENSLDISVSLYANQTYTASDLSDFNTSIVHYLGFPSIGFSKVDDYNQAFSFPASFGYTIYNPHKHLSSPRYPEESFNYDYNKYRCYSAGQVGGPDPALTKWNYGHPGFFTVPAVVYGNTSTKEGTLIYHLDREGTNPKSWQFYCEDDALVIKSAHTSDSAFDPYGVGGYIHPNHPLVKYSVENKPTWSLRIRPFVSPNRWVDWHGYELYREETKPKLVEYGWIPKSFYERYQDNEISLQAAEMPMVLNVYGISTGNLAATTTDLEYYRQLYRESVNPNLSGNIFIPTHYQSINLNAEPNRNTGDSNPRATYNGWESWAGQGTGIGKVGPEVYRVPDLTGINPNISGEFASQTLSGSINYCYNLFPFNITSGSEWTVERSGMDMVIKIPPYENRVTTNEIYKEWAYSGDPAGLFASNFSACLCLPEVRDKMYEIARVMGSGGINAYHDTFGVYGRGCTAKSHTYIPEGESKPRQVTHPRGIFSRYYNQLQQEAVSGWNEAAMEAYSLGLHNNRRTVNTPTPAEFALGQSSEHMCDANILHIPITLIYEQLGPIYKAFLSSPYDPRPDAIANFFGSTDVDGLSDLEISLLLAIFPTVRWACNIDPPNWIQRCPALNIVHSDRHIQNEWTAVYQTNAWPHYFNRASAASIGTYGQITRHPDTPERNALDWSSHAVTQWPYSNRMSVWHLDNQVNYFFTGIASGMLNNSIESVASSSPYDGLATNLMQKIFRIQAYLPDYIYHGKFKAPLEDYVCDYNNEAATTVGTYLSMHPNTLPPSGQVYGDEKIPHFVREHRSNGNLVIVAGNWYSGEATMSGEFDPASYDIDNGYQVYSLDVNTAAHGTRTLLAIKSAGETYDITSTLDQYEYKVFEIEVSSNNLNNLIFADLVTDYTPVAYSYDVKSISTNDISLAYSYGTSSFGNIAQPIEGFRSPATQQILNNLPQWMKMRQSYESNGWKLTNSWGMALERVLENIEHNTSNLNIITAETYPLTQVGYIDITSPELLTITTPRNLLFNSAFSIKDVVRSHMPAGWQQYDITQSTSIINSGTTVTAAALMSSGTMKIGQEVILGNIQINKLVGSIYVLCNAPNTDVTLYISIERTDGTSDARQAKLTSRSGEWRRLVLPMDINAQVYRVTFSITAICDAEIKISAPQLEIGSLTSWSRSELDILPHVPADTRFNLVYAHSSNSKTPIFPIRTEDQFREIAIPTRIERMANPKKDLKEYSSSAFGRKVDQLGEVTRTEFAIVDSKIYERAISPTPFDVFGIYNIKDLRFFEELQYGTRDDYRVTLQPVTSAVRKDYLYVVCKETFNGAVKHVIKIIDPRTPPNGEDYLESIIDFDLNLNFDKTLDISNQVEESIFSLSFSDVDPTCMIITTTNNVNYYYRLFFDYFFFNSQKNRLYLAEIYPEAQISVI